MEQQGQNECQDEAVLGVSASKSCKACGCPYDGSLDHLRFDWKCWPHDHSRQLLGVPYMDELLEGTKHDPRWQNEDGA